MSLKTDNRARVASTVMSNPTVNESVIVRNGVTFKRSTPTDGERDTDSRIVPDGFVYQWNRYEVYNQPDLNNQTQNYKSGWQAVPASRHDGMFMPPGHNGPIINGGLRLEERPIEWEMEDRARLKKAAHEQINVSRTRFKLDALPQGFTSDNQPARAASFVRDSNQAEPLLGSNAHEIPIAD